MKRYYFILLISALLLTLTACSAWPAGLFATGSAQKQTFPGKIAILTDDAAPNSAEYLAARQMVEKYGEDKIIHDFWPEGIMDDADQREAAFSRIAADPEIQALIINPVTPGAITEVNRILEIRDDIFIVVCMSEGNAATLTTKAGLLLATDEAASGSAMVLQAKKMGAATFVHYSFPSLMEQPLPDERLERIMEKCADLGLEFVDAEIPAHLSAEDRAEEVRQFILDDVPKMVASYGQDTAFFGASCVMQAPLIEAVVENGAVYPQPCCPSPFHGFPRALGLITEEDEDIASLEDVIADTIRTLKDRDMLGRLSTWPAPAATLFTQAGVEYAVKRLNGEVTQEGIDVAALEKCMKDQAGVDCYTNTYTDAAGAEYANYLLVREAYLTYDDKLYDDT